MALPGSATIEKYKESVLHLKTFQSAFDFLYGGHGPETVPAWIVFDFLYGGYGPETVPAWIVDDAWMLIDNLPLWMLKNHLTFAERGRLRKEKQNGRF